MKKKFLISLFIIFNIFILVYLFYNEFYSKNISFDFSFNIYYFIISLLLFIFSICSEGYKLYLLVYNICNRRMFFECIKVMIIGKYFDNLTPSGFGGQPSQIAHFKKLGINFSDSSVITLCSFIILQFCFIFLGIISIIFGSRFSNSELIKISSFVGLLCYSFVPFSIIIFSIRPKGIKKIVRKGVNLLYRIKIVKDKDSLIIRLFDSLNEYSNSFKLLIGNKRLLFNLILFSFIYQVCVLSLPYFCIKTFNGNIGYFECIITTVLVYASITLIPTPGNSGVAEGSFASVFSGCSVSVFFPLLLWRIYVFYSYLVLGCIVYFRKITKK